MGEIKNLSQTEAIAQMKKLAEDIRVCMFCTKSGSLPFETRPMSTSKVDEDGTFWFLSDAESDKNFEIGLNDSVQLVYAKPGDSHFMTVYGKANVTKDKKKIDELWNDIAKAWFKEGKDDPRLSVIKVTPDTSYYWDTKYGKMVSLLAIAASAVSSKSMDTGIEGKLEIKKPGQR